MSCPVSRCATCRMTSQEHAEALNRFLVRSIACFARTSRRCGGGLCFTSAPIATGSVFTYSHAILDSCYAFV